MKKLMFLGLLSLSATSFAQTCFVDMVDRYDRVIRTFTAYGDQNTCIEGMKECRKSIRLDYSNDPRYANSNLDCVRRNFNPNPGPNPNPYPNPYPTPTGIDARRNLNQGESVIFNNRYVTVAGVSYSGSYAVRSTDGWNTITNNLRREALAVTNGCNLDLCVNDSVIDVTMAKYVKVAALEFDDRFVTKSIDGWNTLLSNVDRRNLAETKGCIGGYYAQICVGNTVINRMNRYMTVVGVQVDGRVVLKSTDGWNTLTTNVNPSELVITR